MFVIINIDARSSTPIYEQIVIGIKELILKNILSPGDKLPSVREMASTLTTNPNTVSKAYAELERMRIIEREPSFQLHSHQKSKMKKCRVFKMI